MVLCFLYLIASNFCKPSSDSLANIEQDKHEIACSLGNVRATAMKRTFVAVALHSFSPSHVCLSMPVKLAQKYCLIYALLSNFYEVSTQVQLHRRSKDFVGKFHYLLPQLRNIV